MSLIHKASLSIGRQMTAYSELDKGKEEILIYMVERLLNNAIFIIGILLLSYALSVVKTTIIVTIVFIALRSRFGGFHTKSDYICLVLSMTIPVAAGYLAAMVDIETHYIIIAYFVMFCIAAAIGVVDNENKRLKDSKKNKFKLQGFVTLTIIFIINILVSNRGYVDISNAITIGALLEFVNLPIGKKFT